MIKWLQKKLQDRKNRKQQERFDAAVRDPALFTDTLRAHLKSCFPEHWTHISNVSQLDLFKIAISMELLGYHCSNMEDFEFCLRVLTIQKICTINPTNPHLIKRA